jgi:putative transposase
MATHLDAQVEAFRSRLLDSGHDTFVGMDALTKGREHGRTVKRARLIAVGVDADGDREVLGLGVAADEHGAGWPAVLRSRTARGPCGVKLVISDAGHLRRAPRPGVGGRRRAARRVRAAPHPLPA